MDIPFFYLALIISAIMVLTSGYFFWQRRDRSLALLSLGGALYVLEFCLDMFYNILAQREVTPLVNIIDWSALIVAGFLIFWSTCSFLERPLPKWGIYGNLLGFALVVVNAFYYHPCLVLLLHLFEGIGLIGAGVLLLARRTSGGILERFTGAMLLLYGIIYSNVYYTVFYYGRPEYTTHTWKSPWAYLLDTIVGALMVVGFLFLHFQKYLNDEQHQNTLMRHASHELKTLAMTISNYSQSALDGIYPTGSLENSIQEINHEAKELEKQVRDLLYLSKLDADLPQNRQWESFELAELIIEKIKRYSLRRPDLLWEVDLLPLLVMGDRSQWGVVMENILDNQTRYAVTRIVVSLQKDCWTEAVLLRIWNDGIPIDPETRQKLFQEYQTGTGGEFGLGLVIVKKIVDRHQCRIRLENEAGGVAYYIEIKAGLIQ